MGSEMCIRDSSLIVSETGTSYYNVFVDDELHRVVKVCGTDTLINVVSVIDKRLHSLRMQKRSEGEFGKTTIHRFVLSASGQLQASPTVRTRHIEFIGNSLTCGYGVMVGTVMSLLGWKRKTVIMPLQPW